MKFFKVKFFKSYIVIFDIFIIKLFDNIEKV